jgi:uncharacterized membrane protein
MRTERSPIATISGSYGFGWEKMWQHFLYLFLVAVIVGFANAPTSIVRESEIADTAGMVLIQIFVAAYAFLVLPVIKYGGDLLYVRCMRDEKIDISEMFNGFKNNYLNIILANLLTFAIVGLGIVFFIIPGIILGCRLVFVSYLVMDKKMEPVAAVEKSWAMTRGHGWKIFGMGLLAILVFILGLLCLIVGVFFALMWIGTAFASLYHAIDLEEQNNLNANGAETEELG